MTNFAPSDTAELVTRIRASEPDVGLQLYDRFADRIHDFVLFLTRDGAMAAETTRDVIVMTAHQDPSALSDPETLRAWLYAQARNETFALLSSRGRTPAADRVVALPDLPDSPTTADLGSLVWTAMAAFSERDQALVTLHLRHGLEGEALADAMGLSAGAIDVLLPPTLERVESQTAALLALATDQLPTCCPDLLDVCAEWDGMFSPLVRGRVTQMLQDCTAPRPDGPGPMALLQTIPLCPAPASLRETVAERLAMASRLGAGGTAVDPEIDETIPPDAADGATVPAPVQPDADPVAADSAAPGSAVATDVSTPHSTPPAGTGVAPDQPIDADNEVQGHALATAGPTTTGPIGLTTGAATADVSHSAPVVAPKKAEPAAARTPLPLAVALGVAVGLVIAAALFRILSGDAAPAQVSEVVSTVPSPLTPSSDGLPDVKDPLSGAAGAALTPASPGMTEAPGRLSVPGEEVVVTADAQAAVRLGNSGGAALSWRVKSVPQWVVLNQMEGSVDRGATVEIQVGQAQALAEGDYEGDITFAWEGPEPGEASVRVVGAVERIPELQNLRLGSRELAAAGCGQDQTEIEVLVADESPIAEVMVTAAGPGPETQTQFPLAADPAQPGRFVGVVGPFQAAGIAQLEIEASDVRDNRAAALGGELSVSPC